MGATTLNGQSIIGSWEGVLVTKGMDIPLIFHFGKNKGELMATIDSPEQNSYDIPVDSVGLIDSLVTVKHSQLKMVYTGILVSRDTIKGLFTQGPRSQALLLVKVKNRSASNYLKAFIEEEVNIKNKKAGVELSGTLTYPKAGINLPTVILISGSGPQDRNSTLFGKKPFQRIAEHLTRSGYAVMRFDDRGVAKSSGSFAAATSFDFAEDVECIFKFLKKNKRIDKTKIGLLGHSEGSLIASIVASRNKEIAFILSLGGPGTRGDTLILSQAKLIMERSGMNKNQVNSTLELNRTIYKIVLTEADSIEKDQLIRKAVLQHGIKSSPYDSLATEQLSNTLAQQANTEWFKTFLSYDPALYWTKVHCPVFAINGVKDVQVPAVDNISGIQNYLAKAENYDVRVKMYPNLNHLFQTCNTGMLSEYATLPETISGLVLNDLVQWLNNNIKLK